MISLFLVFFISFSLGDAALASSSINASKTSITVLEPSKYSPNFAKKNAPTISVLVPAQGKKLTTPIVNEIYKAYENAGLKIKRIVRPNHRILNELNSNKIDAILYFSGKEDFKKYGLKKIPFPLVEGNIFLVCYKTCPKENLPVLRSEQSRIALTRTTFSKKLTQAFKKPQFIFLKDRMSVLKMIKSGRANFGILSRWEIEVLKQKGQWEEAFKIIEKPMAKIEIYSFLSSKYKNYVPKIVESLKESKKRGVFDLKNFLMNIQQTKQAP